MTALGFLFLAFASLFELPARGPKICGRNCIDVWKNSRGMMVESFVTYTAGRMNDPSGAWTLTSDYKMNGIRHKITGEAKCFDSGAASGGISRIISKNLNCWCRIADSECAGAWVFTYSFESASNCSAYCAHNCASCLQYESAFSCERSALLAIR